MYYVLRRYLCMPERRRSTTEGECTWYNLSVMQERLFAFTLLGFLCHRFAFAVDVVAYFSYFDAYLLTVHLFLFSFYFCFLCLLFHLVFGLHYIRFCHRHSRNISQATMCPWKHNLYIYICIAFDLVCASSLRTNLTNRISTGAV